MAMFAGSCLFALILLNLVLTATSAILVRTEYDMLWQIWNQTNGPYWQYIHPDLQVRKANNWSFHDYYNYNPCRYPWVGVLCLGNSRIFTIELTGAVQNISGTLPSVIHNLTSLIEFSITENDLRGPIPTFIDTPSLGTLNLSYNHLTGSIPAFAPENFTLLNYLGLSDNHLNSTVPSSLFELPSLLFLSLSRNNLTGSISESCATAHSLLSLSADNNHLIGTLPRSLPYRLEQLFLDYNGLTGALPEHYSSNLNTVRLSKNRLSGSINHAICDARNLSVLGLCYNMLTGTLPSCLGTLHNLTIFQVQENRLTGSLQHIFNPQLQPQLLTIDVSDNGITGSFPEEIFQLPGLVSIAAGKNCFKGQLPSSICSNNSQSLAIISLDGMQSSSLCLQYLWDPLQLTVGYYAKLMTGSIPTCIWSLPAIALIHLSGNGFSGSLPSDVNLPKSLQSVAITHNEMRGSIPSNFQNHPFVNLDLSYNKFKGEINGFRAMPFYNRSSDAVDGSGLAAELVLKVNRLSGYVPSALHTAYHIDILSGNLFQCPDSNALPEHDPSRDTYFCGSQELDSAAFVSVIIASFVGLVMLFTFGHRYVCSRSVSSSSSRSRSRKNKKRKRLIVNNINKEQQQEEEDTVMFPFFHRFRLCLIFAAKYCSAVQTLILRSYKIISSTNRSSLLEEMMIDDDQQRVLALAEREMHEYSNIMQYLATLNLIRRLSWLVAAYSMFICLPIYIAFYSLSPMIDKAAGSSSIYSTHEQRYTWGTTSAFLTGNLPAAILLTLWTLLIWLWLFTIIRHYRMFAWLKRTKLSEFVGRASIMAAPMKIRRLSFFGNNLNNLKHSQQSDKDMLLLETQQAAQEEEEKEKMERELQQRSSLLDNEIAPPVAAHPSSQQDNSYSFRTSEIESLHIDDMDEQVRRLEWNERLFKYTITIPAIFLLNLAVSIAINAAYLLLQDTGSISPGGKITIQVLMAGFKIFWNMVPIRLLMNRLHYGKSTSKLHVTLLLTNTVLAPCLATAFTDRSCFADIFFGADSICSAYDLNLCTNNYIGSDGFTYYSACTAYSMVTFETSFTPTFIYYYSCGSKLLTAYIPVYIYSYTMLLMIAPLVYLFLTSFKTERYPAWFLGMIDGAVRPQDRGVIVFTNLVRGGATQAMLAQHLVVLLTFGVNSPILAVVMALAITVDTAMWQVILVRYIKFETASSPFCPPPPARATSGVSEEDEDGETKEMLMANVVQSSETTNNESKPAFDEDLLARDSITLLLDDNLLRDSESSIQGKAHLTQPERERLAELHTIVGRSWLTLRNTMWLCFYWAMLFYGFILFDIAGDHAGWEQALWVVICSLVLILITRLFMLDFIIFIYATVTGQKHFRAGFSHRSSSLGDNSSSGKHGGGGVKGMRSSDYGARFL